MAKHAGRTIEVETLDQFDTLVAAGAHEMRGWLVQDVDLRDRTALLLALRPAGALLLGCRLTEKAADHLRDNGALVFPSIPKLPFDPYRATLYSPDDLYAGIDSAPYVDTPDARIYAWSRHRDGDLTYPLSRALHDHAIDQALAEVVDGQPVVGVMGGHDLARGTDGYRTAAQLGRELALSGRLLATGGGPGAMEAANLGAYLSAAPDGSLDAALGQLVGVPDFAGDVTHWARAAFAVRDQWPGGAMSLGIPTWFYGHEPPNAFAALIAKYFHNSLREDTLLRHCTAGIVFLAGAAGTVQEIFQDACENYYADEATVAPMVLVGRRYWTEEVPAWPLLVSLARGRPMERAVHLVDHVCEVPAALTR